MLLQAESPRVFPVNHFSMSKNLSSDANRWITFLDVFISNSVTLVANSGSWNLLSKVQLMIYYWKKLTKQTNRISCPLCLLQLVWQIDTESSPSLPPLNREVLIQVNNIYGFMLFLVIHISVHRKWMLIWTMELGLVTDLSGITRHDIYHFLCPFSLFILPFGSN